MCSRMIDAAAAVELVVVVVPSELAAVDREDSAARHRMTIPFRDFPSFLGRLLLLRLLDLSRAGFHTRLIALHWLLPPWLRA